MIQVWLCALIDMKFIDAGSAQWVLTYKRELEDVPMWIGIIINVFFIIFFEEHGPAAEVCLQLDALLILGTLDFHFFTTRHG